MLAVLVGLTLTLWALTAGRAVMAVRRTPVLRPAPEPALATPQVAVFVPARDERADLPTLLASLRAQTGVQLEIVVYDDGSTDGTGAWLDAEAARDPALQVLHGPGAPPAGWCGKPHALSRAVEAYRGDATQWLFVDADVVLEPGTVAALVAELEAAQVDLVSPLPTLVLDGFWAKVLGPNFASVATLGYPPARVNDPADPTAFFNGQLFLIRRQAYLDAGGFAAVRDQVLEDVALARRLKARGARLRVVNGQRLVRTRMYGGLGEHLRGWSKNLFALLGARRGRALSVAAFVVVMAGLPLTCGAAGALAGLRGDLTGLGLGLAGYLLPASAQVLLRALGRAAPCYAPLAPLASLIVAGTIVRATFARGPVSWKGRRYPGPAPGSRA